MPLLFSGGQGKGSLLFLSLWSMTGRCLGHWVPASRQETMVQAGAWPRRGWGNVHTQCSWALVLGKAGECCCQGGGSSWGPQAVAQHWGVLLQVVRACLQLSGGIPSEAPRRDAGYTGPARGDHGCCTLRPLPSCWQPGRCPCSVAVGMQDLAAAWEPQDCPLKSAQVWLPTE